MWNSNNEDELIEKWNSEKENNHDDPLYLFTSTIENAKKHIIRKIHKLSVNIPNTELETELKKIEENIANKIASIYFYSNKLPRYNVIAHNGIREQINVDDCSLKEVLDCLAILEFINCPEDFIPNSRISEIIPQIPNDLDQFRNL